MSDEQEVRVTGTDIASVGEKLQHFQESLPESEQAVIGWLLQRAAQAPADDEVEGYFSRFAAQGVQFSQVARANPAFEALGAAQLGRLNPGQLAGVSVVVGVGVMF